MPRFPRRHRLLVLPTVLIALAVYGLAAPPAFAAPGADLQVGFATRNTAIAGDPANGVDFKMQATNNGDDPSDGFDFVVTFPGTNFIPSPSLQAPPTVPSQCDAFTLGATTSSVTCHIPSLAVQSGGTPAAFVEVVGTVAPSVADGTHLNATGEVTPTGTETDPNPDNNSALTTDTVVQALADLSVSKSASTDGSGDEGNPEVVAGRDAFDYTVEVTNNGPSDNAGGFTVSDTLPAGVTFASAAPEGACSADGEAVTCNELDGLAADASESFTIHVTADADAADTGPNAYIFTVLHNQATVAPNDGATAEPDPDPTSDQSGITDTRIDAIADLDFTSLTASPNATSNPRSMAGNPVTYTMKVKNTGPSDAGSYTVSATRPTNTTVPGPQTCSASGSAITCDRPPLANGATDTFTLTLNIPPDFADTATNSAPLALSPSISAATTPQGGATGNDGQSLTFDVISRANLSITKTQTTPFPGNTIYANSDPAQNTVTYHIGVTNAGPSDAQSVQITDTLDSSKLDNPTYCPTSGGSCSAPAQPYTGSISVGTQAPGSVTYDIMAHAKSSLRGGALTTSDHASLTSSTPRTDDTSNAQTTPDVTTNIFTVADPATVPVTVTSIQPSNTKLFLTWTTGPSNGGTPVTDFHLSACPTAGGPCILTSVTEADSHVTGNMYAGYAAGLTNGTEYRVTVTSINAVGESDVTPASTSGPATPNPSSDANVIKPQTTAAMAALAASDPTFNAAAPTSTAGIGTVDSGLAGGAKACAAGATPSSLDCGDIVGQYTITTPAGNSHIGDTIKLVAGPDPTGSVPCLAVTSFKTGTIGPDECIGAESFDPSTGQHKTGDPHGKLVTSDFPTTATTLNNPHLEKLQQDATITTYLLGAPCLQLVTNADGTDKLTSGGQPICANPNFPINKTTGTNICPDGTGWTAAKPCAYIYYYVLKIPGYSLANVAKSVAGARPVKCSTAGCDAPVIIGSTVQQGIKLSINKKATQVVPTWCTQSKGTFNILPCVFKVLWLNNSTSSGNNDIQWQFEFVADPGGKSSG